MHLFSLNHGSAAVIDSKYNHGENRRVHWRDRWTRLYSSLLDRVWWRGVKFRTRFGFKRIRRFHAGRNYSLIGYHGLATLYKMDFAYENNSHGFRSHVDNKGSSRSEIIECVWMEINTRTYWEMFSFHNRTLVIRLVRNSKITVNVTMIRITLEWKSIHARTGKCFLSINRTLVIRLVRNSKITVNVTMIRFTLEWKSIHARTGKCFLSINRTLVIRLVRNSKITVNVTMIRFTLVYIRVYIYCKGSREVT
jgi:hypothetical protein